MLARAAGRIKLFSNECEAHVGMLAAPVGRRCLLILQSVCIFRSFQYS